MRGIICAIAAAVLASTLAMPAGYQPAFAQDTATADSEIPPEIPTSAFASQSALSGARLSPDGSRLAFVVRRDETTYISVYDANTRELVDGMNLGEEQDFNWFRWAGNNRLLFSMTASDVRDRYRYSRLYFMDFDRHALHPLIGPRMAYSGDDLVHIDPEGRYVLVSFAASVRETPTVWRFDLGGEEAPQPVSVETRQDGIGGWVADNAGVVRIAVGAGRFGRVRMRYRSDAQEEWQTVARTRLDDDDTLDLWDFMGLRAGSDLGYSIGVPEGGERRALMEFDFATAQPGRIVFSSPDEDVASVFFDDEGNPVSVGYSGDSFRREWLDPQIEGWRRQLGQALTGRWIDIIDIAPDRSRLLVLESGPADPGALYVFTPRRKAAGSVRRIPATGSCRAAGRAAADQV